jgi:hypothetical protein
MCIMYNCIVFLVYRSTQQFCDKQIITTILAFIYCLEVLPLVSTLLSHHWDVFSRPFMKMNWQYTTTYEIDKIIKSLKTKKF